MTPINKGKSARFYIYKNQKIAKRLYMYLKRDTFQKVRQFALCLFTKSKTLYVTQFL